jgi:uncharacterized protein YegL
MPNMPGPDPHSQTADEPDWGAQLYEAGLEFADNPEPRCPCVLLLDTSRSMSGEPIAALNQGLEVFRQAVCGDSLARRRVEVAIVTFGGTVEVRQPFITVDLFTPPVLEATGRTTPMAAGILTSLDLIEERKRLYDCNGIANYRPWLFMITDGDPRGETPDLIRQAVQRLRDSEARRKVAFFAVGVGNAKMTLLGNISKQRPAVMLKGLRFNDLFEWLSRSTQQVAHSQYDEQVALPPVDWGTIG